MAVFCLKTPFEVLIDATNMTKTEKMRWRKLCEVLATDPNRARRARAATALRGTIAEEKKKTMTANDASLLRVAEKVFGFLEQGPWQGRSASQKQDLHSDRRSAGAAVSAEASVAI